MHIEIGAEKLFSLWGFSVTNSLLLSWIVVLGIVAVVQMMARRMSLVPTGLQNAVEGGVEAIVDMMDGVLHSRDKAIKYLPYVATFFFMILFSNWAGILPGVGSVGFYGELHGEEAFIPFFRSPASDLNYTLALAVLSVLLVNVFGIAAVGFKGHISKFFNFSSPINFFVGILELIGEFSKMISLSFRLFGNVFAGEVLLIIVGFLAPYLAPVPFLMLEVFVGLVQALVFMTLTLVFLSIAIEHHT